MMINKLPNNRVVGAKQTIKAINSLEALEVYIAENADSKVTKPIIDLCEEKGVNYILVSTMQKLGSLCDIDVGAATACVIKI